MSLHKSRRYWRRWIRSFVERESHAGEEESGEEESGEEGYEGGNRKVNEDWSTEEVTHEAQ